MKKQRRALKAGACALALAAAGTSVQAPSALAQGPVQGATQGRAVQGPNIGFFGTPGLIDMPTAYGMGDGEVAIGLGYFPDVMRLGLTAQITPRLSGSFRYMAMDGFLGDDLYFDRSFDLRYILAFEGTSTPAVKIGLRDFGGTGIVSSEYVVLSKTFGQVEATTGLGWGRLGSRNSLGTLMGSRKTERAGIADTGRVDFGQWFQGPVALFGGLVYRPTDNLSLSLEYSSDRYAEEEDNDVFTPEIPVNVAATYRFDNGIGVTASYMYGQAAGVMLSYRFDPANPPGPAGGREGQGPAVVPRSALELGWPAGHDHDVSARGGDFTPGSLGAAVSDRLAGEGIAVLALERSGPDALRIWIRNERWQSQAQALGRAARSLTGVLPAGIETMEFIPTRDGVALSSVTLQRSDLEELAGGFDNSWQVYARTEIADAAGLRPPGIAAPRYEAGIGIYAGPTFSNPDNLIAQSGLQFRGSYMPAPGVLLSTRMRQPLLETSDGEAPQPVASDLPNVRTSAGLFEDDMDFEVNELKAEYFARPGENLYSRLSLGHFEKMYGGVSGEVLWKPVSGPMAFGLELNYARRRDPDTLVSFGDYDAFTGYASAYYDFGGGYLAQVDAGRYLAEDWGATLALDREFANGFRLGAYFTLTDVPFGEFGEGSFDKGIRFSIPLTWLTGEPSRSAASATWRPINGDGGARMQISNRLYEKVRDSHDAALRDSWGRFWR